MSDPRKQLVRDAYDGSADAFAAARRAPGPETTWVARLLEELPESAWVLDLGCGNGVPIAEVLTQAGHEVTGVDFSEEQIRRAQQRVRGGQFILADMMSVSLADKHFHGCIAWDSVFHLPPDDQPELFRRVHGWLQPRSPFVVTFGCQAGEIRTEHLERPIYYGALDPAEAVGALEASGFRILEQVVDDFSGGGHMVVWAQS